MYQQSSWYDLQSLRYRVWQTEISNKGHFLPFYPSPLKTQKLRILKKWKNLMEISSFYTSVSKITIIWGTVPEIRSQTDRVYCHFGPYLAVLHSREWGKSIFQKLKKTSGDVIILHMCTKNHNHMMYLFWDIGYERHNFLSFWAIFCPFTPLLTPKIKIWNTRHKNPGDIIILHMCAINENHMMYGSWDIRHNKQNFLSFWTIFCTFNPLTTKKKKKNQNFQKMKKLPVNIIVLHMYHK